MIKSHSESKQQEQNVKKTNVPNRQTTKGMCNITVTVLVLNILLGGEWVYLLAVEDSYSHRASGCCHTCDKAPLPGLRVPPGGNDDSNFSVLLIIKQSHL